MMPARRMDSAAKRLFNSLRLRAPGLSSLTICLVTTVCSLTLSGCQSTAGEGGGFISSATSRMADVARDTFGSGQKSSGNALARSQKYSEEGRQALQQARELFDNGDYTAAAKRYEKIAAKYKETAAGEEAQFQVAESWFALKRYPAAQDGYDQLFIDYPATRFVQPATRRLYTIAQEWLDLADPAHRSKIRTVSAVEVQYDAPEDAPKAPSAPSLRYRILPNFIDRSRPVFDTQGRALKALKGIWLNDPTGPLAADALMATATYYLRQEDYVEAARYFDILREEYPDSPHLKDAFLLGSHVQLMSYQGPLYDGASLEGASKLTAQTLSMFPDSQERPQLREDLKKIHLLKAQRIWRRVQYYERKKLDRAIGITCVQLINEYPNTRFADMARDRLATLDPNELKVLPGFDKVLESLSEPPTQPDDRTGRVKSVSASEKDAVGRTQF